MADILQELENNEAVLLMYLADELPARDKAEVEQVLGSGQALNQLLIELRLTNAAALEALRQVDALDPLPVPAMVAGRRAKMAVRQWAAQRARPLGIDDLAAPGSFNWRRYATLAAALLLVIGGGWMMQLHRHASKTPPSWQTSPSWQSSVGSTPDASPAVAADDVPGVNPVLLNAKLTPEQQMALLEAWSSAGVNSETSGAPGPAPSTTAAAATGDTDADDGVEKRLNDVVAETNQSAWVQGQDLLDEISDPPPPDSNDDPRYEQHGGWRMP